MQVNNTPQLAQEDWIKEQSNDGDIGPVVELVQQGNTYNIHVKREIPQG